MKKFTKIDEELLKENIEIENKYKDYSAKISAKMDAIKNELKNWNNKKMHWGHIGSLSYINDNMDNIIEHLNLEEDTVEKYNL